MENIKIEVVKAFMMKYEAYKEDEVEIDDIIESTYDDSIFEFENFELMVLTDSEADEKATENIRESLWAFNPNFVLKNSKIGYNPEVEKALSEMQSKLCESANELVYALIEDFDDFVTEAIASDGRGHFMNSYDNDEYDIKLNDELYYVYIMNK